MTATPINAAQQDRMVDVDDLKFDLQNPRIPTEFFQNEDEAAKYLLDEYDVEELVKSILSSGWIDYEPLIVEQNTNIVYEGNRRLAALRLIRLAGLRHNLDYRLPDIENPQAAPEKVRVRFVENRSAARRFIAFKHITGPLKWDAYAKAKYAAAWLEDGESIDVVSKMLGDGHNTIRRLVTGYQVLEQAKTLGFDINDRTKKRFSFSHLYTAVSRPAVRAYIGMDDEDELLTTKQVAAMLGISVGRVRQWLADGTLASIKPGHDRLIRRGAAEIMRTRKTTPGPPKGHRGP